MRASDARLRVPRSCAREKLPWEHCLRPDIRDHFQPDSLHHSPGVGSDALGETRSTAVCRERRSPAAWIDHVRIASVNC